MNRQNTNVTPPAPSGGSFAAARGSSTAKSTCLFGSVGIHSIQIQSIPVVGQAVMSPSTIRPASG